MAGTVPAVLLDCCTPDCEEPISVMVPGPPGDDAVPCTPCEDGENAYTIFTAAFTMPAELGSAVATVGTTAWMAVNQIVYAAKTDGSVRGYLQVTAIGGATSVTLKNLEDTATSAYTDNSAPGSIFTIGSQLQPGGVQGAAGTAGGSVMAGAVTGTIGANEITLNAAKGSLLVGNGTEAAAVPAGTNGHMIAYDSTDAEGVKTFAALPITDAANFNVIDNRLARLDGTTGLPIPMQGSMMGLTDGGALQSHFRIGAADANAKGADAVDLQANHSAVTQVASGARSVIAGGSNNTVGGIEAVVSGGLSNSAAADRSVVAGGDTNTINAAAMEATISGGNSNAIGATGIQAVIGGGDDNTADGEESVIGGGDTNSTSAAATNSTIGGGRNNATSAIDTTVAGGTTNAASSLGATVGGGGSNAASGQYATVPGGANNVASGTVATALGYGAVASKYGQVAHAAGFITVAGDAQASDLVLKNQTLNATPTPLIAGGVSAAVPNNTSWMFDIRIVARTAAGLDAIYKSEGVIRNNAGTTSVSAVTTTEVYDGATLPVNPVVVDADDPNDALRITVTGIAATTILWVASVWLVEVGH